MIYGAATEECFTYLLQESDTSDDEVDDIHASNSEVDVIGEAENSSFVSCVGNVMGE